MMNALEKRLGVVALWALAAVGCAADGCGCTAPIPGGFPPEERTENMVQVRISATGIEALEDNASDLITNLVGEDGLVFEVPPDCGGSPKLCCDCDGNVITPCGPVEIDITEQPNDPPRLEIDPVTGASRLDLTVRARVRTQNAIPVCVEFGIDFECDADIDTTESGADSVRLELGIDLVQNAQSGTTDLAVSNVQLEDLNSGDIDLSGGFGCTVGDALLFLFINSLTSPIEDLVADTVADQVCKQCPTGTVDECGVFADRCEGGVCMQGDQCIQELGLSGRLFSSALVGSLSTGTLGGFDLYEVAGGYATTDNAGVALGMLGGFLPAGDERARCGPSAGPPPRPSIPISPFFQGNTRPDDSAPFDVAIGVHQHNLDLAAWAAYEGGTLCLNVGTSAVDLLTTETVALLMPSVLDLLHGQVGQIVLGLRPQSPPEIGLGAADSLLTVDMPGLEIDFFTMVDDQFVRVMTAVTDLSLPLDLEVDGNGDLVPVLGDLGEAFGNVRVVNSDALLESPEEIAALFPALLAAAGPALSSGLGAIELPDLGGMTIAVDDITSVENDSFLAIFGRLEVAQQAARQAHVVTAAAIADVRVPDTDAFRAPHLHADRAPAVELALAGEPPAELAGAPLEWQFRIDDGLWTPFTTDARTVLRKRVLWLQGRHTVEVRARVVGRPETTDPTPVVLNPIIDTIPPEPVLARLTADEVWVMGSDNVTRGGLEVSYRRVGDGAWRTARAPARIDLGEIGLSGSRTLDGELEVIVRDQAGNESHTKALLGDIKSRFHGSGEGGCECSSGSASGAAGPLAVLLLGWLVLWRRRGGLARVVAAARRIGPTALLVVGAGAASSTLPGCDCSGAKTGTNFPNPVGRFSAIAADGDRVVVSAYDNQVGDLVLIERDGEQFVATFVDGLPEGVQPVDPGAYRDGITDPGPNVGAFTSIGLREGLAIVAYQDIDNAQLKLAVETAAGEFALSVIDPGDGAQAGLHSSLALDASGRPAVAYLALAVDDGTGGLLAQLRLAESSSTDPSGPGDWTITVLDEAPIACAGLCAAPAVCALQQGAQRCLVPTDDCGGCGDDEVCASGACVDAIADPPAYDIPQGAGLFANLAFLPDGRPVVVYYDRTGGDLVLQVRDGEEWTREVIDDTSSADTGQWADIAVDAGGVVHIAYQDAITDRLLYTTWDGAPGEPEVVDDGVREGDRPHPVGASAAIFVAGGDPGILYQDAATVDLLIARRVEGGWETAEYLAGPPLYGFYVDVARSGDGVVTSSLFYDRAALPESPNGALDISTIR